MKSAHVGHTAGKSETGGDNNRKRAILTLALMLAVTAIAAVFPGGECSAGIVHADSIRTAVVDTILSYASSRGLSVTASVPAVSHVFVQGVEHPRILVHTPDDGTFDSRVRLAVDLLDGANKTTRSLTALAKVRFFAAAVVAVVDIKRGDVISPEDIAVEETEVTAFNGYFIEAADVANMRAKRRIRMGTILTTTNIEHIPLIERGDRVVMKACIGGVVITAKGTAREDGCKNEFIRVYNETTRKTLDCRIIDETTVILGGEGG